MTNGTLLTVVGICVSGLFGVWGLIVSYRKQKYPGELTFLRERSLNLFSGLVSQIDDLSVVYKGEPISSSVVFFKGHIVNTGTSDISSDMVQRPITATLPENYTWLEASIISPSPEVAARMETTSDRTIQFHMDLLRCGEAISFRALVAMHSGSTNEEFQSVAKALQWNHRIRNTNPIRSEPIPAPTERSSLKRPEHIISLIFAMCLLSLPVLALLDVLPKNFHIDFNIDHEGTNVVVRLKPISDGEIVRVQGVSGDFDEELPISEFFAKFSPHPTINRDKFEYIMTNIAIVFGSLAGASILYSLWRLMKRDRLTRILSGQGPNKGIQGDA